MCQVFVIAGQAKQYTINYIAYYQTKPNGDEMSDYIAIARRAEDRGNLVLGRAISEFMWGIFETPHKFSSMHEAQQVVNSTEPPVDLNHVSIETDDAFKSVLDDWRAPSH